MHLHYIVPMLLYDKTHIHQQLHQYNPSLTFYY